MKTDAVYLWLYNAAMFTDVSNKHCAFIKGSHSYLNSPSWVSAVEIPLCFGWWSHKAVGNINSASVRRFNSQHGPDIEFGETKAKWAKNGDEFIEKKKKKKNTASSLLHQSLSINQLRSTRGIRGYHNLVGRDLWILTKKHVHLI